MRMRTMPGFSFLCGSILILAAVAVAGVMAQDGHNVTIQLHSKWTGLAGAKDSTLSVVQRNNKCYVNGQLVESKLVENLLREIQAPADAPSLANLGITQSWLNSNAGPAYAEHAKDQPKVDQKGFLSSYRDPSAIEKLMPELLHSGWTDDYPLVELTVQNGGSTITIASKQQNVFMIPFEITENGAKRESYNAGLARALVALMPPKFTNRDRLGGDNLRSLVGEKVIAQMHKS